MINQLASIRAGLAKVLTNKHALPQDKDRAIQTAVQKLWELEGSLTDD